MAPVSCHHCGAPTQPGPDGRVYKCAYCGTQVQVAVGADQVAAGMALDLHNVDALLAQLARMPVERRSARRADSTQAL